MEYGIVQVLKNVELFSGLSPEMLQLVADNCTPIRRKKGSTLVHQNEPGSTMYVILKGRVKVTRTNEHLEEVFLAERSVNDCIGEMSLLDGSRRSADVTAITDCDLVVLEREPFMRLLRDSPELALKIMATLVQRIREIDVERSRKAPVRARLARKLCELMDDFGEPAGRGVRITVPISRTEIANRINAAREVVSRAISELRQEGVVADEGKLLIVRQPDRLRRIAES